MNKLTESKMIRKFTLLLLTSLVSMPAFAAAETTPWKTYLFVVMSISLVTASIISVRNKKIDSRMGKLLLTGLYFWVLTFAQLTVLAVIYYFNK